MSRIHRPHPLLTAILAGVFMTILFSACTPRSSFVYLNDISLSDTVLGPVRPFKETLIEPDDQLSIQVSAFNPDDIQMFNSMLSAAGGGASGTGSAMGGGDFVPTTLGYMVDKRGMITLPYIGEFLAAGLTIREMEIYLAKQLERFIKQPIVKVRFLNHYISLIGDVAPSRISMPNERLTLFDVLSKAGDLRSTAIRDNILVVREEKGYRTTGRVNVLSKTVYDNPYFYLQNKDMIYVEPVQASYIARSDKYTRLISFGTTFFTIILTIVTLFIR
jgi:polysaccharide export outer membrane protein